MTIISIIQKSVIEAVKSLYGVEIAEKDVLLAPTRKDFEGDYTITVFAFSKAAKKSPVQTGEEIGNFIKENTPQIDSFNVIQGFLNLVVSDAYWIDFLSQTIGNQSYGQLDSKNERVMVEYSSPNTNKPLHLGHIRNILLGWSTSKVLQAAGYDVVRTKVVNDRGIAICKSMLAWQLLGEGKTPQSAERPDGSGIGMKGDHFVGDYYVQFEKEFQKEYKAWQAETLKDDEILRGLNKKNLPLDEFFKEYKNEYFNKYSQLGAQAREMLLKWESGDTETVALWQRMNGWVYEGFNETYKKLGVSFDKIYYESNTYMLGKDIIEDGIKNNVFYQKPDTSVWIDLTDVKLDHKLVLRSDGTSVYITQDIGMARLRDKEWHCQKVVYVVADEQNYHFQVLFEIMKKLGEPYANGLHHLSYGMVDLPTGKMKSREGTVVDADDLIAEVIQEATNNSAERGEVADFSKEERAEINRKVGMAALKYHIVKVNPKKRMVFDPQESVDLQGQTGPYIQYSYVRINGVLKKAANESLNINQTVKYEKLEPQEKDLIFKIYEYPKAIEEAATTYDPSVVANYCYDLAKSFHKFWHDLSIFNAEDADTKIFRLQLSQMVGQVLKHGMDLLGIEMPERM
jgi:arginyl-tRNA synthetase